MKKVSIVLLSSIFVILLSLSAGAVPEIINYQGKLTDKNGVCFEENNGNGVDFYMTFCLYDKEIGGTPIWCSTERLIKVIDCVFNVQLGDKEEGNSLKPEFFNEDALYLEVIIYNNNTQNNETLNPRQRITSTAYAMNAVYAAIADTLDGKDSTDFSFANHQHSFADITGTISDEQVPDDITVNHAATAGSAAFADNADKLDGYDSGDFMKKGCYVSYSYTNSCLSGFTNKGSVGSWGRCSYDNNGCYSFFRPAGGSCPSGWSCESLGSAYVCCQE